MSISEISKDQKVGQKLDSSCGVCKRSTKHLVLSDIHTQGFEDHGQYGGMSWYDEYQIIQCQGCESIVFRSTHENSEEYDYGYTHDGQECVIPIQTIDVYPNPEEGRQPINDYFVIPQKLHAIYRETISSLNSNHAILTGIGIRAIVETICKDKNAQGNNLYLKINDLVTQGVLTQDGADILHKLRSIGNDSAHEVKPHDSVQLGLAIDVIDHLLQGVYILAYHAKSKFK
ncbi:DUF4145 domain-containing protein [Vibrio cholerae]|uniref:DUF4145 domain-containing protein n=1 Tax=Vibrio cholerae TaxID=666 RepID=UPI001E47CF04|nr:DUF4145 domain-containing protein [Vibrio cholerae]